MGETDHEQLWAFVAQRRIHVFPSEHGYWVAFDPQTERLGRGPSPNAAVADLARALADAPG